MIDFEQKVKEVVSYVLFCSNSYCNDRICDRNKMSISDIANEEGWIIYDDKVYCSQCKPNERTETVEK